MQIGRSADSKIDFLVTDTAPGNKLSDLNPDTHKSTISRYACRIVVDREPPYTARVFAAGFDKSSNIFLGVSSKLYFFKIKIYISINFLKKILDSCYTHFY